MALNYYAINKVIGGKMIRRSRSVQFGSFRLLDTLGAALGARPHEPKHVEFTYPMDALVVRAFEDVRDGWSPERVLWDLAFATRFQRRARQLGVHASAAQINRRLLTIRKSHPLYKAHGIVLSPTTQTNPQASIVPRYAHVIEFALVRLRCRYGVSIDDILLDPKLGEEYETIARSASSGLTPLQLRLGALYIRKTHHLPKDQMELFDQLQTAAIEKETDELGTLDTVSPRDVPATQGLVEVLEQGKYLYIASNQNLHEIVSQLVTGDAFRLLSNDFWKPRLQSIAVRVFCGDSFQQTSIRKWELKLISEKNPVFNWPVHLPHAA